MKKKYKQIAGCIGILFVMSVLWAACADNTGNPTLSHVTPTAALTAVPTKEPVHTPTPEPAMTPTIKPELTEPPVLTPTPELTATPEPTATSEPTTAPTNLPPTATVSPTATVTPTPTVHPLTLVYMGWQQTIDPTETYAVVFPNCYDAVSITKQKNYFYYTYTASQHAELVFEIAYYPEESILGRQEAILLQYPEIVIEETEHGFTYFAESETLCVTGEVLVCLHEVLGTTGVMQVENRYPTEQSGEYRKKEYSWYVCVPE